MRLIRQAGWLGLCALLAAASLAAAQNPPPTGAGQRAIVVPARPVLPPPPPKADPRTLQQAMRDHRAFNRCLLAAQSRLAQDAIVQPGYEDPLEHCRRLTTMRDADAPPTARR